MRVEQEGAMSRETAEFVQHYHEERLHQVWGNELHVRSTTVVELCAMKGRERFGGPVESPCREAA
jgi:hypothetical protein